MDNQSSLIAEYFRLPRVIASMKKHIKRANELFWQRSFISSPMNVDATGYRQSGRPFTMLVDDLVDFESYMNECIEQLSYKQQSFNDYLNTLAADDLNSLKRKYIFNCNNYIDDDLTIAVYGQCLLINADVKREFLGVQNKRDDISKDYKQSLDEIMEMLG